MELRVPEDVLLGCHLSISGGVDQAAKRAQSIGCTVGQIFTSSNRRWKIRDLKQGEAEAFREESDKLNGGISAHACYLINLAKDEQEAWEKSLHTLIKEIRRADTLGIRFLVLHPGSHVGSGEEAGLKRISEALSKALDETTDCDVVVLLETMAGQGTGLGYKLEHLRLMRSESEYNDRIAYCLDTCHMHAGGYDLSTGEGYDSAMDKAEEILGLDRIEMIHLNDSKGEYDSRVDRHEHIGEGTIGEEAFRRIVNDERWDDIPKILETPVDDDWKEDYGRNLDKLVSYLR